MISEAKFFKAKGKGRIIEDLSNIITAWEKTKQKENGRRDSQKETYHYSIRRIIILSLKQLLLRGK